MKGAVKAGLEVTQQGVDPTELRQVVWVLPPGDNGLVVSPCRGHGTEADQAIGSGRSQAVRLPKHFRLEGREVRIRRHCALVILRPFARDWAWLDALSGPVDADVQKAVDKQPASRASKGSHATTKMPGIQVRSAPGW
jgi:antitoxin VapB